MILDTSYNKFTNTYHISYVDESGKKQILKIENFGNFPTYIYDTNGKYDTWDNKKAKKTFTKQQNRFNERTFWMEHLQPEQLKKITAPHIPNIYSFDIEVEVDPNEFPEPSEAKFPILTISIVNKDLDTIVLGTKPVTDENQIGTNIKEYIQQSKFYQKNIKNTPLNFKYIYFESELEMLGYFLKFVKRAPVIAGWNSILFDWQYIINRVENYYGEQLKISMASLSNSTKIKRYKDMRDNNIHLKLPNHTIILDMMDVVGNYDLAVMPTKESLSLEYVASQSPVGLGKIKYDGDLQTLYEEDYDKYVFYNAVDSILVMLIDKCFKTLDNIYAQALYVTCPVGDAFSKIALAECLFWNYFHENNKKVVPGFRDILNENNTEERGELVGAYVKQPIPGLYEWIACCDFASLYPSTIITCNISIENYIGKLDKYLINPDTNELYLEKGEFTKQANEIPITWNQFSLNNHFLSKFPELYGIFHNEIFEMGSKQFPNVLDYSKGVNNILKKYNSFISVNGCIYKNDKDYAFKEIQWKLKKDRGVGKYLKQHLDAQVMNEHFEGTFGEDVIKELKKVLEDLSISIPKEPKTRQILKDICGEYWNELLNKITQKIIYYTSYEQACKLLGNSMYGGSSHQAFAWFNMDLANDITGEARNLIHIMESFVPNTITKDIDIIIDKIGYKKIHDISPQLFEPLVFNAYNDTDSGFFVHINTINFIEATIGEKLGFKEANQAVVNIYTKYLNKINEDHMSQYFKDFRGTRDCIHEFELETVARKGFWLNVKKRYAQSLSYKDGKFYDESEQSFKIKGLEVAKASYPQLSRDFLKKFLTEILQNTSLKTKNDIFHRLNDLNVQFRRKWEEQAKSVETMDNICPTTSVNNYTKYVSGTHKDLPIPSIESKCPAQVKGLAIYNWLREKYNLKGDPIYGGKMRTYIIKNNSNLKGWNFTYPSNNYPKWAFKYAPMDVNRMYEKCVIDPINRILEPIGVRCLRSDGGYQTSLFDLLG